MNAKQIIENGYYEAAVMLMDDAIREKLAFQLAPCTDEEFLIAYVPGSVASSSRGRRQPDGIQDHIGVVEKVDGNTVTTIEGNYQDSVTRRTIAYNDGRIAGYARPKYADEYAPGIGAEVKANKAADFFKMAYAGTYVTKCALNMRHGAGSKKYEAFVKIPKGSKVQNYGYYSLNGKAVWLYVQYKTKDATYTGFCSRGSLKKS